MRKASVRAIRAGLSVAIVALATPLFAGMGVRLGGSIGSAPSFVRSAFDADKADFKFSARGMEFGFVQGRLEVDFFMDTVSKGRLNRGYKEQACYTIGNQTKCFPEGTYLDPVGVRLVGAKLGGFQNLHVFNKWARVGIPLHVGATLFTGEANQVTYTNRQVDSDPTRPGPESVVSNLEVTKVPGRNIVNGARSVFPVFDVGLAVRIRTAGWAEVQLGVAMQQFRFPALAWGMTFKKFE
jgi:hypothetical protein